MQQNNHVLMNLKVQVRNVSKLILFAIGGTALIMTPGVSFDPFNLPKLSFLMVAASLVLIRTCRFNFSDLPKVLKLSFYLSLATVFFVVSTSLFHTSPLATQYFGFFGRNTGIFFLVALFVLCSSSLLVVYFEESEYFSSRFVKMIFIVNVILILYGIFQLFGLDPIDWVNPYNEIILTFGNPNFSSAFLAICLNITITQLFFLNQNFFNKIVIFLLALLTLFLIIRSDSSQGIIACLIVTPLLVYAKWIKSLKKTWIKISYLQLYLIAIFFASMAFFNYGPFANFLYQDSLANRKDMWLAGIHALRQNLLFGIGADSYWFYSREYRNAEFADRWGINTLTTSTHNLFLDFGISFGVLVQLLFLILVIFTFKTATRILFFEKTPSAYKLSMVVTFLSFIFQSFFSVNQITITTFGFVSIGALLGYEIRFIKGVRLTETLPSNHLPNKKEIIISGTAIPILLVSAILAILPFKSDVVYKNALLSGDATQLFKATFSSPGQHTYYTESIRVFLNSNLESYAFNIAQACVKEYPRSFECWEIIQKMSTNPSSLKDKSTLTLRQLDPVYATKYLN